MNYEIKNYNLKCAGFKEGKIEFMPTYKYSDDQTNIIICDSIDHIPSWTDRILFMINEILYASDIDPSQSDYLVSRIKMTCLYSSVATYVVGTEYQYGY